MPSPRLFLNHSVECSSGDQFSIVDANPGSTTQASSSLAEAPAQPNPHRPQTAHQAPAGSFLGGFRTWRNRRGGGSSTPKSIASAGINATPEGIMDQQQHYVGLDVSLQTTSICVIDDKGTAVWRGKCASTPESITRRCTHTPRRPSGLGLRPDSSPIG